MKKEEEKEKSSAEGTMARVKRLLLRFQTIRTIAQFFSFILFFGLFLGIGPWAILVPVTGLLGVPTKTVGEAFGSLQYMLYLLIPPWLALASIFLAAVVLNRAFCAWACPFGLVQDILGLVKRRHSQVSPRTHKQMIYLKYLILTATLLISGVLAVSAVARSEDVV